MMSYKCPTCRVELTNTPVTNYSLKSIVEACNVGAPRLQLPAAAQDLGEDPDQTIAQLLVDV